MSRAGSVRTARVSLALAACATALVPTLGAQRTGTPSAMSTEAKRSEWNLVTTVEQGWDSNVRYLQGRDADMYSQGSSTLTALRIRPRSRVGVTLSGSLVQYRQIADFNAFNYGLGLDGNRRLSATLTGFIGAGYQKRLSTDVVGAPAGLPLLARSNQITTSAVTGLERRFSPATTGHAELVYSSTTFDSPLLVPGSALVGKGNLRHRYGRRSAIGVLAEIQEGASQGVPLRSQMASMAWEPALGGAQARLVAGATRIATGATPQIISTGGAQLSDSVGGGELTAGVTRGVDQAFGVGQLLTNDAATLSYEFRARRGNFITLAAAAARSTPSSGVGVSFTSQSVTAGLRRVLRTGLTFGANASYRKREDLVVASGYGGTMAFGYTLGSR